MVSLTQVRGIFQPLPTPFDGQGELDEPMVAQLVEHFVTEGAHSLFLGGPFGQGPAMRIDQRIRLIDVAFEAASDRIPVVPDIGAVDPYTAITLGRHAAVRGAVAVAISAPYFYADRSVEELLLHFAMIDDAVRLPFLIVSDPPYQGYPLSPETLARIRERTPRLVGVHPAKTGVAEVLTHLRVLGPDFRIFPSPESLYPGMLIGQAGTMSPPLGLCLPLAVALVTAIDAGDNAEAERLHLVLLAFLQRVGGVRPWYRAAYLEGLRHLGLPVVQSPRWPTPPVPDHARVEICSAIDDARDAVATISSGRP